MNQNPIMYYTTYYYQVDDGILRILTQGIVPGLVQFGLLEAFNYTLVLQSINLKTDYDSIKISGLWSSGRIPRLHRGDPRSTRGRSIRILMDYHIQSNHDWKIITDEIGKLVCLWMFETL